MTLPGEYQPDVSEPITPQHEYVEQLVRHFKALEPKQTSNHSKIATYMNKNLAHCTHVWLRREKKSHSLQPRYTGPYRVLDRTAKLFTLDIKDSSKVVSIDRIKPAFLSEDSVDSANVSTPKDESLFSNNPNIRSRCGRPINVPSRYKDYLLA